MRKAEADIAIFGGGVAGLWLLNRLRQTGFSAILFDSGPLGGGQTLKSQGIIHGGMKYNLKGTPTKDAEALAAMPAVWKQCLNGKGEIDLSGVPVLSQHQYLWSPTKLTAKLVGFFANFALSGDVAYLPKDKLPSVFAHDHFKGEVYALDELVIDIPSLVRELVKYNHDALFKIEPLGDEGMVFDEEGNLKSVTVYDSGQAVEVHAQQFVFTAGAGNEVIINKLKNKEVAMQRRPLHMVLVKTHFDCPLYAHCLGLGGRPRITITTHYAYDGSAVWYLGGALADRDVRRAVVVVATQIQAAREELQSLFPWLDFSKAEFASFMIDRAEPQQKNGIKPETSFMKMVQNMVIAWPTKLVLAPKLAEDIIQHFLNVRMTPQLFDTRELRAWPMPPIALPVWEELFCKNVA